ncbi:MAG: hypothetical protein OXE84_08005, partial [Rhodobacteraceae bacterium]|nr:hypothetical protein [Paracoccaceae bacterium]
PGTGPPPLRISHVFDQVHRWMYVVCPPRGVAQLPGRGSGDSGQSLEESVIDSPPIATSTSLSPVTPVTRVSSFPRSAE